MTRSTRLFALLVLAIPASGCALVGGSPPERYGGRGTLTQAAREAAKDSTDKRRRLDVGDEVPSWHGRDETIETTHLESAPGGSSRSRDSEDARPFFGAMAGGGSLGGQEFDGFAFGGVHFGGFLADRVRLELGGLALAPNLTAYSVAGQGLKDEIELAVDASVRYYLTPAHTFLGVYPLVGLRFGTLFWNYRSPVQVIADGETKTLTDDYLNYFGLYGGLGVSLIQARHFSTGLNLTGGFRAYDETTFEGFRNTLFPTTGYTQLAYELSYKF